jgi:hypothetical protein
MQMLTLLYVTKRYNVLSSSKSTTIIALCRLTGLFMTLLKLAPLSLHDVSLGTKHPADEPRIASRPSNPSYLH